MVTLNTMLIPKLKENGIGFRYIGNIYDPMTIIVTHKNFDICRVDMNHISYEPYNYNVYWFPSTVKNARRLKRQYLLAQELIDDIHKIKEAIENISDTNVSHYVLCGRGNGKTSMYYDGLAGFTTWCNEYQKERDKFDIKDVIFNNPATIVLWADGTKTVVKAENEPFDPEKGLAMAISKRALGGKYDYYDTFKKYVGRYEKKQKKGGK